ncbi:LL-diaminopimelate aminotransferase [bacterium]|nr:LL-diaminopimelate aminotransferase [bacterium]
MKPIRFSQRLDLLPPYLFNELDRMKVEAVRQGVEVIDFGIGDPDRPTPGFIVEELCRQAALGQNHRYPSYKGMASFRQAVAEYYSRRGVTGVDPDTEVLTLIGSKEGIAHLPLALIDPSDVVLVPDPGYPVYLSSTLFAGGTPYFLPLEEQNDFLPDLEAIPEQVRRKAKLLFLNYPNNPTTACANRDFFEQVCAFAEENRVIVCHDASYLDITFNGYKAPSLLECERARQVGLEIISLSKNYNMTGWRVAAAVGNRDVIAALLKIKMNIDSGVFDPIQKAGVAAMVRGGRPDPDTMAAYAERRIMLLDCLDQLGWSYYRTDATFYIWVRTPAGQTSLDFTKQVLQQYGLLVTPGVGFGKKAEGYIRFSLTLPTDRVAEAVKRLLGR